MRASKHRTYWMDVFADRVEEKLSIADLEAEAPDSDLKSAAANAFVTIERLSDQATSNRVWSTIQQILAQAPDEPWNVRHADYAVFAWDSRDKQELPVGFTIFSIADLDAIETSRTGPLENISFSHDLIFVRPAYRGRGFGRYLSVGVLAWLARCRVRPPFCAKNGVNVLYHADFDSEGGAACAQIITDWFTFWLNHRRDCDNVGRLSWLLASFTEDTGF